MRERAEGRGAAWTRERGTSDKFRRRLKGARRGAGKGAQVLEARGIGYRAGGQEILSGIDLTVRAGESIAVTGPSGSGKTSLLSILAGLTAPTEGTVLIDSKPLRGFAGPALGVAVVLQGYGLVSLLTA